MPGKRDQASHDAAIAKVAGALPYADLIRTHLGEVLTGAAFSGSRRSQEFLRHVVECALAGQWDRLKERSLGIDVFSRDPSYDTGEDSIVRVTASDIRKRLLQYYSDSAGTPACRIDLPAGSYIPEFLILNGSAVQTAPAAPTVAAEPAVSVERAGPLHTVGVGSNGAGFNGAGSNGVHPALLTGSHSSKRLPVRAAILSLLAVSFGWALGLTSARLMPSSAKADSRFDFYRELLGPIVSDSAHETEIALSNPRLLLYVGSNDSKTPPWPSTVNLKVPPEFEKALNPSANDSQAQYPFHFLTLTNDDYTGIGEATSAFNLAQLMRSLGRSPRLTESRFLNWRAMRNLHMILLGAPQMSAWTEEGLKRANFTMEHDVILNARPRPGERQAYNRSSSGKILEDYGLIWMARLPSGSRQLLMAGLTSAGTAGVSDFFCDPDRMRPVYDQLRAVSKKDSLVAEWQVLLHIHARENVPLQISLVSLRAGERTD